MKVFVASNMPTTYPCKLQKPSTVSNRVRDTADEFILDSGIGDDVSNHEVLDLAAEYNADYVVGKDYLHDQDRTTESIKRFIDKHAYHDTTATPLIPLQPPHAEHYQTLVDKGLDVHDHYVLGGMATDDVTTADQIAWIRDFHNKTPDDLYVHGLGVGGGMDFVSTVAGKGWLDSVDCSTPEQAAMFGKVLDLRLRQREMLAFSGGEGKSRRTYPLAAFNSWQVHDVWVREAKQQGLEAYG
jgi:hypothetical protein